MDTLLEKYMKLAHEAGTIEGTTLKAQERYRRLVRQELPITNIDRLAKSLRQPERLKKDILVTFEYDAKTAEKLPYWDRHPLVLINKVTRDGWIGVNLHYLPPKTRARMLWSMKKSGTDLEDVKHDMFPYATKRYLASHIIVKPQLVPEELYDVIIQMPFENFVNASAQKVWQDTTKASQKKRR